ncbi:hypothetical protein AN477_15825 [Alicyclobacillus ferrooxydans]|uniref:L-threonylcarbamoyladenylate synthase n=2 Tax=Alicyclobacillus ferrooxydans TaxID=471514 RepID=A0A0N8PNY3_9BACL|nr:L-threonylcarbamoyladenylate synthase [Alicyclobacillus ferrooxydans]KPV42805.1 hypothetical protein AN477_15825 [Alicyclobacillus ferrooxydans]
MEVWRIEGFASSGNNASEHNVSDNVSSDHNSSESNISSNNNMKSNNNVKSNNMKSNLEGSIHTADQLRHALSEPAHRLRRGQVIAFPTETVYGLGANAWDESAVQKVFQAKGRPSDNPLIVHIADLTQLKEVISDPGTIPGPAKRLMDAFWPGPLTIIFPAHEKLATSVHPGMDTVGVRMPNHPVALALIAEAGCPVAAPSANSSGRPSPTVAETVLHDLADRIDGVVDGGPCQVGLESTVIAVTETEGVVYRPGWITPEELQAASGVPFTLDPHLKGEGDKPKSPGMKYRHYAPDARVWVWWGDPVDVREVIAATIADHPELERVALICPADFPDVDGLSARWSPDPNAPYENGLGHELYERLRWGDKIGADALFIVGVEPKGHGLALMNRLQKASEGRQFHATPSRQEPSKPPLPGHTRRR